MTDTVTPLRSAREPVAPRTLPHNVQAEASLIGAILANNRAFERVQDFLEPQHFADPAHGRVYAACKTLIERGQLAQPVTLRNYLERDQQLAEVGGVDYLARLAAAVITIYNARDLGQEIYDCFLRRELIDVGEDVVLRAADHDLDEPATKQIEYAENRLFTLAQQGTSETGFIPFQKAMTLALDLATAAYKRDGQLVGVPTGFSDLDRLLGGLHKSDLVIVAGRPAMGKTAFATNIAHYAARSVRRETGDDGRVAEVRETVAFFSLEMSSEQLATRILSEQAHVRSDAIRRGDIQEEEYNRVFAASQELNNLLLFIDDTPALSVSALRTRARRLKRTHGLSMIVVDYLQLLQPPGDRRSENRVQEVSEITRALKAVAKELQVPVLALSQLSRAVEQRDDKRPLLSDLRESGSIEQDADVVMFLYREEYYLRQAQDRREHESDEKFHERLKRHEERLAACRNKAEVIIAKQRHGPVGIVELQFEGEFTRFADLARGDRLPELRD
ncbi:MAG: replicative DNA helicase [Alphaproteobacteria bacterium]|nr:replicative DNA helicase [Alphaproteobacteria bacterium]